MKTIKHTDIKLRLTSVHTPEQYDALYNGEVVGYLRLRSGHFRAEYEGNVVYSSDTIGNGAFEAEERMHHLPKAKERIAEAMMADKARGYAPSSRRDKLKSSIKKAVLTEDKSLEKMPWEEMNEIEYTNLLAQTMGACIEKMEEALERLERIEGMLREGKNK